MRKILLFVLSIPYSYLFAQHKITGLVLDENMSPIPYTSVFDTTNNTGINTGRDGFFLLKIKKTPTILRFSNIGYYPIDKEINSYDTIRVILKQKTIMLNEVEISANEPKSRYIGSPKNKRGNNLYLADNAHYQLALKVHNFNQELYKNSNLISFSIKIFSPKLSTDGLVNPNGKKQLRLRVYEIDTFETVGKDILHENVFLKPSKRGWYQVTFSSPLSLPEKGFYIAIEWLEDNDFLTEKKHSKYVYDPTYGIAIHGHEFKAGAKELAYYSSWLYDLKEHIWNKDSNILIDRNNTIPAFRLEIKEYE